ncbi:uncharacterized protein KQ657_002876 [Scheffersomyces spartinae]|uniref:4a-hydroxytetrahydrobiopterin dehydratase n=1 Tax=Scheffersomyces spartinae TaxID=45513 RepID=A0A9P8AGS6_9ASCO|nr:uncharacterized protein KQ657_002876 [Scheffersomyces spartinae]KAG7191740.1 hypothetical protein KQ657_002876 [Scheffersomyces spartinae]
MRLSRQLIESELKYINARNGPKWKAVFNESTNESHLESDYKFPTFAKTWLFLNEAAQAAHELKHHPTITTTYNKVNFKITTHDMGNQISNKDLKLVRKIDTKYTTYFDVEQKEKTKTLIDENRQTLSLYFASKIVNELTKKRPDDANK